MGIVQGLDHVIESANILRDKKDIVFMLIGDGIEREKLVSMKEKYKLKKCDFCPIPAF